MFLENMSTDEPPADPYKVIGMLKRKVKRRFARRSTREFIIGLQTAIRTRNIELGRVRHNYERLEVALMRQHIRDTTTIERLKRELSQFVHKSDKMGESKEPDCLGYCGCCRLYDIGHCKGSPDGKCPI